MREARGRVRSKGMMRVKGRGPSWRARVRVRTLQKRLLEYLLSRRGEIVPMEEAQAWINKVTGNNFTIEEMRIACNILEKKGAVKLYNSIIKPLRT